ncbi:putative D-aminoacylase [Colletotrichum zoysiae]|uniref:D-aminoacylase n=1 Tax=Colletotrichum zoysiae TaxID=1216348 RepID=A0AAD9M3W6_9PEZI|nr:putative D-aminoacylase [Colletotrichum zoysiae]
MASGGIQERLAALEPVIRRICTVAGAPGISIGVSHGGEVIHRANYGFADVESQSPTTSETVYRIGTLAKALTASAVGILVDQGRLDWDTPIRDILPGFQSCSTTVTENLTIVDLLSHRAGLARSNFWWQGAEGALLLDKSELLKVYKELPPVGRGFRADWAYSNWGYALVGEVIEQLSGISFGRFLEENLLRPLGMSHTSFDAPRTNDAGLAKPYAAMDDASIHPMTFSPVYDGTVMAPAMGGRSSADDLLRYSMALLAARRDEASGNKAGVIRHAVKQLSGHIFTAPGTLEKSYAFGFYRTQLPNTVLGMGWNSIYVDKMPTLVPRGHAGPVIAHGGSLPGYHVAMALLPELDSSVVVCTNSIALGDVSGWVSLAVLEALIETPSPSDYVRLASEAAQSNARNVDRLEAALERPSGSRVSHKPLDQYVGSYRHASLDWFVDIKLNSEGALEVAFMGLESQTWTLKHHEVDTFLWLTSREEQAKRGRMTTYPLVANHFKLIFGEDASGHVTELYWPHEAGLKMDQQRFVRSSL